MQVKRVNRFKDFLQPDGERWADHVPLAVQMMRAPVSMQPTEYIRVKWADEDYGHLSRIGVSAVHNGDEIAIRLEWACATQHDRDAAAIALPVKGNPPLITMGQPDAPIHFLHWKHANNEVRSTIGTGIGTTDHGPEFRRSVNAVWDEGHWQLVVIRPLGKGQGIAPLLPGLNSKIGFAVWQGANGERAGLKAFSINWKDFSLEQ